LKPDVMEILDDWVSNPALRAVFQALPATNFVVFGAPVAHDAALVSAGGVADHAGGGGDREVRRGVCGGGADLRRLGDVAVQVVMRIAACRERHR
jgi:hypothetical protein